MSDGDPAVRMIARDVWPSFSGVAEVVCVTLRPESFTEHLDDDRAAGLMERVLATSGASLAWAAPA